MKWPEINGNEREWGRAKLAAVAGCGFVFAGIAFAYWWHQSDVFSSIDSAKWYTNGTVNGSGIGLVGTGGSVISKIAVPYTPNDYEVKAKVKLLNAGGGDYVLYTRASTNAQSPSTGQYYSAEWLAPSCNGSGSCSGWMSIYKKLSAGSHTQLAFVMATTTNWTAEIRFQAIGTGLYVWMNGVMILNTFDSGITSGAPGVGVRSTPSNCALERVDIGHYDNQAPNAPGSLTVSRFPQNIRLRWTAPTDPSTIPEDAGTGSGVAQYHVWKNGIYQGSFANASAPGTWIEWADAAATDPTLTYTYQIGAADYHFNTTYAPTVTVQPSAILSTYDARQVGVKTLGTYWGAGGENIDMRSGNLNYTLPLVQAQMRGGGGVTVGLTYNSQVWTKLGNVEWRVGDDVGYGFGWKMLIGSVAPVYENNAIKHYVFTDSSGSEYKLDQNAAGKWTSKEGIYVTYDTISSPHRLYFNSGVFWELGSQSGGIEEDAGTRYPTKIQDTNGNQLKVLYNGGVSAGGDNTSARIATIEDVRAIQYAANDWRTYTFNYATGTGDVFPHLSSVANHINSGETYTMTYWPGSGSNGFPVTSPFTGVTDWRNVRLLWIVTMPERNNMTYTMTNSNFGEVTAITQPYGGTLEWDHPTFGYASNYSIRQVSTRRAKPNATTTWSYGFFPDTVGTTANVVHGWTEVQDAGNATRTRYEFETSTASAFTGLMKLKQVKDHPSGTRKIEETPTWAASPSGNPYISAVVTKQDPDFGYVKTAKTEQDVDLYGNMTAQRVYAYGGSTPGTTLIKTFTNTYVTASNYVNAYMRNRLLTSTLTAGGTTVPISTLAYDNYSGGNTIVPRPDPNDPNQVGGPAPRLHDSATYTTSYTLRGNPTSLSGGGTGKLIRYDMLGMPAEATTGNSNVKASTDKDRGYAVPKTITPNGTSQLSHTLSWNSHLGLTQDAGPNGATSSVVYSLGVPTQTTSPHGAVTTVSLSATAPHKTTMTNGKWVRESYDGFGRTVKVETGNTTEGVKSVVSSEYAPCACSPLGKLKRMSRPYAGGGSPMHWIEYNYDSQGRTVSVVQPAASGSTMYSYQGNTVTVTDPAGKWKAFEVDAAGNLVKVTEPNPAGGTWNTNYLYNSRGQVTTVLMGVQTRTFSYDPNGLMTSSTNPENGTATCTYDATGLLQTKQDATGQRVVYEYDDKRRVTAFRKFTTPTVEDPNQLVGVFYDGNDPIPGYADNSWGMLSSIRYKAFNGTRTFVELFRFSSSGSILGTRMHVFAPNPTNGALGSAYLEANAVFDNEGAMTEILYPSAYKESGSGVFSSTGSEHFYFTRNPSGQLTKMGTSPGGGEWISSATYNVDGTLSARSAGGVSEAYSYNALGQGTGITAGAISLSYEYPSAANNGRVTSMTLSGETVTYAYDALNRLVSAQSSQGRMEPYSYDRYGNLGSIGAQSIGINPTTNRLTQGVYDANGNFLGSAGDWQYDIDNRLVKATPAVSGNTEFHGYDDENKRVWTKTEGSGSSTEFVNFYGSGARLGTYQIMWQTVAGQPQMRLVLREQVYYFDGSVLRSRGDLADTDGWIVSDRAGSIISQSGALRRYRPYGEEYSAQQPGDGLGFATYYRSQNTATNYAMHRYYLPSAGRFTSTDPLGGGSVSDPASWNLYTYVGGDPINFNDPLGLIKCGEVVIADLSRQTLRAVFFAPSEPSAIARLAWHESTWYDPNSTPKEHGYMAQVIMNRVGLIRGSYAVQGISRSGERRGFYGMTDIRVSENPSSPHIIDRQRKLIPLWYHVTIAIGYMGNNDFWSILHHTSTWSGGVAMDTQGNFTLLADTIKAQGVLNTEIGDPSLPGPGKYAFPAEGGGKTYLPNGCAGMYSAVYQSYRVYYGYDNWNGPNFFPTSWDKSSGTRGWENMVRRQGRHWFHGFTEWWRVR